MTPDPALRRALRLVALILAISLLCLAATIILPLVPGPPAHTIGLLQGPIHTDILFPQISETRARFGFAKPQVCRSTIPRVSG